MKRLNYHNDVFLCNQVYENILDFEASVHIPMYVYGIILYVIASVSLKIKPIVSTNLK
jgi:hypothetical protein